ncbi:cytochrome c oxidase assembly protein [Paenibacillus filicis]|uniref:Cytochrome c oxidase assembly protein n=1 Tax=Paenibacillus gyeongsangnamensis TaxID=3388067 RepID=A0ABT4QBH1_9BACL|nr:cytochrome c oxidase assembly protein [Paenibacillus filicis]MCZ8514102.1 cytochrome c oxidase assembly protein [Paenibacillus filicis]
MHTHGSQIAQAGAGTFTELWSPGFMLMLVVVGVLYTLAVTRWRYHFAGNEQTGFKQQAWFLGGLAIWYAAEGSPISFYGHHYSFSAHMLQQSMLYLIMPPFLLLGMPGWLLRGAIRGKTADRMMRFVTSPLVSLFTFNLIFSMYHMPKIMDFLMAHAMLMLLYQIVFLLAAFQMWFPVFCPLPEYNQMSELKKLGYIFLNGILLTPACALIIFASHPMYAMYANVPEQYLLLPIIDDQQLGGVIMKIIQEIVYGVALAHTFFKWYRTERKKEEEEDLLPNSAYLHPQGNTNGA